MTLFPYTTLFRSKYTRLYSGTDPIFEEGDIFRTIVPLKKIATEKVGSEEDDNGNGPLEKENVAQDVAQENEHITKSQQNGDQMSPANVAHDVAQENEKIIEFIKQEIRDNNKVTRQSIADKLGVSKKTVERLIKEIDNLKYIGRGSNGHWELNE